MDVRSSSHRVAGLAWEARVRIAMAEDLYPEAEVHLSPVQETDLCLGEEAEFDLVLGVALWLGPKPSRCTEDVVWLPSM